MKNLIPIVLSAVLLASCSTFKGKLTVQQTLSEKDKIVAAANPAMRYLLTEDLKKKRVVITDATVSDVIESLHIDYDFCVVVTMTVDANKVDCYLYSDDLKTISKLVKGSTRIDAVGDFEKFFTLLDEKYTKIEVLDACIDIKGGK
ncbi:MAG TPA: hypothetical protein PKM65_04190 [Spirochaetota bacterium]|nr:hypothetical protein [Spirochaetota bacterium]HNT10719.1 hypothetical protein [Spirochaetota bacterium]HPU90318.1 hypothetical protein [Spirochaetota bacterium]